MQSMQFGGSKKMCFKPHLILVHSISLGKKQLQNIQTPLALVTLALKIGRGPDWICGLEVGLPRLNPALGWAKQQQMASVCSPQ